MHAHVHFTVHPRSSAAAPARLKGDSIKAANPQARSWEGKTCVCVCVCALHLALWAWVKLFC